MKISRLLCVAFGVLSTSALILQVSFFSQIAVALGRLLRSPLMAQGWVMLGAAVVIAVFRLRRKHQAVFKATRLSVSVGDFAPLQSVAPADDAPLFDAAERYDHATV